MFSFQKIITTLAVSAMTLSTIPTYTDELVGNVNAEASTTQSSKGKVLFDNSHAQTAGAADWVIDGGFSDYADQFKQKGYDVKALDGQSNISETTLKDAKILVIPEANIPFKTSEQAAMKSFVQNGGNIIFISDHYNADRNLNRIDSSEAMNGYRRGAYTDFAKDMNSGERSSQAMKDVKSSDWLSENFGVRFRYNALNDLTTSNMAKGKEGLGITNNVSAVSMHAGSTLAITNPKIAKGIIYVPDGLTSKNKWSHAVDEGVYDGGGKSEGPYVAVSKVGKGKAAFIGDSSLVEDSTPKYKREDTGKTKTTYDGFKEASNSIFLSNLTDWLNQHEDAQSIKDLGVSEDKATTLKDFETPEKSTEPQKEPWSTPPSGYKWYDSSTFAPGSYGATKNNDATNPSPDSNQPTSDKINVSGVSFELPQSFKAGETFTVKIKLAAQAKNTTLKDLRLGIYTASGQQVGQFEGSSSPGYSPSKNITTDQDGHAELTLTGKIVSKDTGKANIRLKQGNTNIKTQAIEMN